VQLQRLGTPYLKKRLDEVAKLVRDMTRDLDARLEHPGEAAARWAAAYRRPLSYVVDLYELAASRNAQVRAILERAGWETQAPGLVMTETAEEAMTILYEGLQRLVGLLEDAARGRGAALPAGTDLLGQELTDTLADDRRFTEAAAHVRLDAAPGRGVGAGGGEIPRARGRRGATAAHVRPRDAAGARPDASGGGCLPSLV
jgi:hypothetical protein